MSSRSVVGREAQRTAHVPGFVLGGVDGLIVSSVGPRFGRRGGRRLPVANGTAPSDPGRRGKHLLSALWRACWWWTTTRRWPRSWPATCPAPGTRSPVSPTAAARWITWRARRPRRPPELIVLDLMLPEVNGLDVCRRVRAEHPDILVIILTALAEEDDRIAGLETGADDYLTKPFSPRELVLRVDSLLRRASRVTDADRPGPPLHAGADHPRPGRAPGEQGRRRARVDRAGTGPARVPDGSSRRGLQPGRADGARSGAGRSATIRRSPSTSGDCVRKSRTTRPAPG